MTRAFNKTLLLALALFSLLAAAKANATTANSGITGTVSFAGANLTGADDTQITVYASSSAGVSAPVHLNASGSFSFPTLPNGNYTILAYDEGCNQPTDLIGSTQVTLNGSATANINLTASAGKVTGNITVNGTALANPVIHFASICSNTAWATNSDGSFEHYLPAGTYDNVGIGAGYGDLGSDSFSITAGAVTNLGAVNVISGSFAGSVIWNGGAVIGNDDSEIIVNGQATGVNLGNQNLSSGGFAWSNVPAGINYNFTVYDNNCSTSADVLGTLSLAAPESATPANANIDISATAGKVIGTISVNNQRAPYPIISSPSLCGGSSWLTNSDGSFEHFLPPGTYSLNVSQGQQTIGTLNFTVTAGEITDLGLQDFDVATLAGNVIWNGAPVTGIDDQQLFVDATGFFAGVNVNAQGGYSISGIVPGAYTVGVYDLSCAFAGDLLGSKNFTLMGNVTTDGDIDITATAGRVTGLITNNDVAVIDPQISSPQLCSGAVWASNSDGSFEHFLAPGNYTMNVATAQGAALGTISFAITAGQTTALDLGTTPIGNNVSVDSGEGIDQIGDVQVTYSAVTTAGTTSISTNDSGAVPPAGYQVIGPAWYEVTTTATYSGEVTVCVHYNAAQEVSGAPLMLVDAANGFTALTSSTNDTESSVICGETTAVSTFAIIEEVFPSIAPASITLPPRGTQQFVATGGSGIGYVWSSVGSGSISATGLYTAGSTGPGSATITVTDSILGTGTASVTVTIGLSISPTTVALAPRQQQQFTASGGSNTGFTWKATAGSVNSSGLYTAPSAGPTGDTVTVTDSVGNTANAIISFTAALALDTKSITLAPGATHQFSATGGSGTVVSWTTTGGSVNSSGFYTAPSTGPTSATVTATDSFGNTASATIAVGPNLSLDHTQVNVPPLGTHQFVASGGSGTGYTFALQQPANGTVSLTGLYQAGAIGTQTDMLTVTDSNQATATATINITANLTISPAAFTLPPRGTKQFGASGGSGTGLVWTASAGGVTNTGFFTAPFDGTTSGTVTVTDSLGNSATAQLSFTPGISLDRSALTLPPLGTHQFIATGGSGAGYVWSLQAPAHGTISAAGLYTAGTSGNQRDTVDVTDPLGNSASATVTISAGITVGPATITLPPRATTTFTASGGTNTGFVWATTAGTVTQAGFYSAPSAGPTSSTVTVTDSLGNVGTALITFGPGLALNASTVALAPLGTEQFVATGGSGLNLVWSLEPGAHGVLSQTGLYTAGATGDENDTVTVTDSLGNTASAQVAIGLALALDTSALTVPPRGTHQFVARGGNGVYTYTLTSSTGSSISSSGLYTASAFPGATDELTVNDELGATATATIAIGAGASISPATVSVPPRGQTLLQGVGGSGQYAFSLESPAHGTISAGGVYTAGAIGGQSDTAEVTDSLGNTGIASITITAGVTVSPSAFSIGPGETQQLTASGGSGTGFVWSVNPGAGGTISTTGLYTAGSGASSDIATATDSLGNTGSVAINVTSAIVLTPSSATVAPRGTQQFTASGGSSSGYTWSLGANATGTISSSGLYTAGGTAGATDTVRVTDSLGNTGTAVVTVGPGIGISPANATVAPGGTQQFSASGGSGSGFVWSLAAGASGTVSASGLYTASIVAGSDTLDVVDSLGNKATATITISAALAITPSNVSLPPLGTQRFTASGGAGVGYAWSVSGQGSISSTGLYTAGSAGSTTDTITVKDGSGNSATATATTTPVASGGCTTTDGSATPQLLGLGLALFGYSLRRKKAKVHTS